MADRYWVGGTANWDATAGTKWATTSGGAGGAAVPTASDNTFFDAASGAVTVSKTSAGATASLDFTGFAGTFSGASNMSVTGDFIVDGGMAWSYNGTLTFSGGGSKTITTNGKALSITGVNFSNAGATWTFTDDFILNRNGTTSVTYTSGTLVWGTNTMYITAYSVDIQGAWSFNNLDITMLSVVNSTVVTLNNNIVVAGTLSLAGFDSDRRRLFLRSTVAGTPRTITVGTLGTVSDVDCRDIVAAGASSPWDLSAISGGSGDCGGNTDITFSTPDDFYWFGASSNWYTLSRWYMGTGGSGGSASRLPLPQDTAIFDSNAHGSSISVSMDQTRYPAINATYSGLTLTNSSITELYGDVTIDAAVTLSISSASTTDIFARQGTRYIDTNNKIWNTPVAIHAYGGGTVVLNSSFTSGTARTFSITSGTFDANDYDVTIGSIGFTGVLTRHIDFGDGTWTLGTTGTLAAISGAGFTVAGGASLILINNAAATARTFQSGGLAFHNIRAEGAGAYTLNFTGGGTYNDIDVDTSVTSKIVQFTQSTTSTLLGDIISNASSGKTLTLKSTTATNATLSKASGTISLDWAVITDLTATGGANFYYGTNSTITDSPGWNAAPVASATRAFALLGVG